MKDLNKLLEYNRAWAAEMQRQDPQFFSRLVAQQRPEYLWIGCSGNDDPEALYKQALEAIKERATQ